LQVRFAGLNKIKDLFSCILNFISASKDEISIKAKKLAAKFDDFNSAELINQIQYFKTLFTFELESYSSVFNMTKLLVIENNNLMIIFPELLKAFYLFLTLPVTVGPVLRDRFQS